MRQSVKRKAKASTAISMAGSSRGQLEKPLTQQRAQKEDFYVKVSESFMRWWNARKTLRAHGRLLYAIFRRLTFAKWTVKLQIAFLITILVLSLVLTIDIHILSHAVPRPWRQHCASQAPFPMDQYVNNDPVGILVGVMSTSGPKATKRRQMIRDSWASHWASRGRWQEGQIWDGLPLDHVNPTLPHNLGNPTSRVVVRFVMGRPKPQYRAAIYEEIQKYNDIVIVPMTENMNDGKTFAFFDWSFKHALVPPPTNHTTSSSRDNDTSSSRQGPHPNKPNDESHPNGWAAFHSRPPAPHDPSDSNGLAFTNKENWVRPDYVFKTDDDSFIMLAELEARFRVLPRKGVYWGYPIWPGKSNNYHAGGAYALSWDLVGHVSTYAHRYLPDTHSSNKDISLSQPGRSRRGRWETDNGRHGRLTLTVDSRDRSQLHGLALPIAGQEDMVTAGWMKTYGEEWGVTWYDEQCWVYDHPKSGTAYSKGFLFPLEIQRIREEWGNNTRMKILEDAKKRYPNSKWKSLPEYKRLSDATYSTVSRTFWRYNYNFAKKWDGFYRSPLSFEDFNPAGEHIQHLVEHTSLGALIEGSALSMMVLGLEEDDSLDIGRRWREDLAIGWRGRYLLDTAHNERRPAVPIGGTVLVHYVKREEYWKDCVEVLLESWKREQTS